MILDLVKNLDIVDNLPIVQLNFYAVKILDLVENLDLVDNLPKSSVDCTMWVSM